MSYDGGKGQAGVFQRIINQMPPHDVYIEGCLGAGAVLRAKKPATWSIGVELDPDVLSCWQNCQMENLSLVNADVIGWLRGNLSKMQPSTLVYLDPPYLMETRRSQRPLYRCEMTNQQHEQLLTIARSLPCKVMISDYWSQMYADLLNGWRAINFQAMTRGGQLATQWLWMNFAEPTRLHDYQYLGENFRERERIKKKINRWKGKLERMPETERRALLAAITELEEGRELSCCITVSGEPAR